MLLRALHGVGIAIIIVTGPMLISTYTTPDLNTNIMGMIMAFAAFGLVIGQIFGGYLVDIFSWHWAYSLNVPFGVIILTVLLLTEPKDVPATRGMKGFDWTGSILAFISAGCLIFVISK